MKKKMIVGLMAGVMALQLAGCTGNGADKMTKPEMAYEETDGDADQATVFFASTFWTKLQNIFGHYCKSKLDETAYLGNLLNLRLHTGAQLSYVTCGQNVPDDIENFNPQKTVKLLLGGKKN